MGGMGTIFRKGVVEVHEKKYQIASQKSDSNTIQKKKKKELPGDTALNLVINVLITQYLGFVSPL